jgi:hypothetical protein
MTRDAFAIVNRQRHAERKATSVISERRRFAGEFRKNITLALIGQQAVCLFVHGAGFAEDFCRTRSDEL